MNDSTKSGQPSKARLKPEKPHPDFPLFAHATGRWAKKVRGKMHYFGPWNDPQSALELWLDQKDELLAGRKPRTRLAGLSVKDACNHYLDHVDELVSKKKRSLHWYQDVRGTCNLILESVGRSWDIEGLGEDEFKAIANRFEQKRDGNPCSPVTTLGHIHRARGMFNWLLKANLISKAPLYGTGFDAPRQREIDNHKHTSANKLFTRNQVRAILRVTKGEAASERRMHAAVLLAINTGCQNIDISRLQFRDIDWANGWYIQPRAKKATKRRAKLWRRTIKALSRMVGDRTLNPEDLVFVSDGGAEWHGRNMIAKEFKRFRELAGIDIDKCGFQWLRHTFITCAIETGDRDAVKISCGHASRDITDNYVHSVFDPRQIMLAKHVEAWLTKKAR